MTPTQTRIEVLRLVYRSGLEVENVLAAAQKLVDWVEQKDKPADTVPSTSEEETPGRRKARRSPGNHAGQAPTETDQKPFSKE